MKLDLSMAPDAAEVSKGLDLSMIPDAPGEAPGWGEALGGSLREGAKSVGRSVASTWLGIMRGTQRGIMRDLEEDGYSKEEINRYLLMNGDLPRMGGEPIRDQIRSSGLMRGLFTWAQEQEYRTLNNSTLVHPDFQPDTDFQARMRKASKAKQFFGDVAATLPQVATTVAATAVGGPWAGVATTLNTITGMDYERYLAQGIEPERAFEAAVWDAVLQAPLEQIGVGKVVSVWRPQRTALLKIRALFEAGATEGITEYFQAYPEALTSLFAEQPDAKTVLNVNGFLDTVMTAQFQSGALYQGAVGMFTGALLASPGMAVPSPDAPGTKPKKTKEARPEDAQAAAETVLNQESATPMEESVPVADAMDMVPSGEDVLPFTRTDAGESLVSMLGEDAGGAVLDLWDSVAESWAERTGLDPDIWYERHLADVGRGSAQRFTDEAALFQHEESARLDLTDGVQLTPEAQQLLHSLQERALNALPMQVTESVEQWPAHLRGQSNGKQAVYDERTGTIYAVAEAVNTPEKAVGVWLHEQGAHLGLRGLFNETEKLGSFLDGVFDHFGAESFGDIAEAHGLDLENADHRRIAAEERLAHIAEKVDLGEVLNATERGVWETMVEYVRAWLREIGVAEVSDKDIARVVKDAVRWTMGRQQGGALRVAGAERDAVRELFNRSAPVELTGQEIPIARGEDFKAYRKQVLAWAKKTICGEVRNASTGWDITIAPRGLKDAFSHHAGEQKILAVAGLREMLERGILVTSRGFNDKRRSDHIFAAKMQFGGQMYVVGMVIREDLNGRRYYDHELSTIQKLGGGPSKAGAAPKRGEQSDTHRASVMNIIQDALFVKTNMVFQDKKGATQFLDDGRALVRLFEGGDVSTIVHETGHILRRLLPDPDMAVVAAHFGAEKGWSREAEERFADAFERYVYEAVAPSVRVRLVFSRLRRWLVEIYHNIRNLRGAEIHPDVRAVFDRLVTTEVEREAERRALSKMHSFRVEPEVFNVADTTTPISDYDLGDFESLMAEAERRAAEKIGRQQRASLRTLMAAWRREAVEQAEEMPLYPMLRALTGKMAKGTKDERVGPGLDVNYLRLYYDEDTISSIRRRRPGLLRKEGGMRPDLEYEFYGYTSPEELVEDILSGPTKKEFIEGYVQAAYDHHERSRALDEDFGEEYAAIQNEALEILERMTKRQTQKIRRETVREEINQYRVLSLKAKRMELRRGRDKAQFAARQAFDAGNRGAAHVAMNEMQNIDVRLLEMERALAEREEKERSISAALRRKIPHEYRQHALDLAARFGLTNSQARPEQELLQFLRSKGVAEFVDWSTVAYLGKIKPGALTMDGLRDLHTLIQQLVHFGSHEDKLIAGKQARDFEDALTQVNGAILQSRPAKGEMIDPTAPPPPSERRLSPFAGMLRGVDDFHAMLLKPEFIFRAMDGFKEFGTVWRELFQPLKVAEDAELELGGKVMADLKDAFEPFRKQFSGWATKRLKVPTVKQSLTKEEVIMVALNSGNQGNRKALAQGFKWTEKQIDAITDTLTPEEWGLVHKVWDTLDAIFPHLDAEHRKVTGAPLVKVEGRYFPLIFDRELSWKADRFADMSEARDMFQSIYTKPNPERGFTRERKGGTMPPLLSFGVISRHVTNAVHYATHASAVRDVQKMMMDNDFRATVERVYGAATYRQLLPWLQHVAKPVREPATIVEKWVGRLRRNTTVVSLGLKVSVALKQTLSYTQTIDELGFRNAMKGVSSFVAKPWESMDFVNARSVSMRNRRSRWDREVAAMYDEINPKSFGGNSNVKDAFFAMIGFMDAVATYPTWISAYTVAMEKNGWEEAKAIEYADMVVRRTQPVSSAKDLAEMQRGSVWRKLGTMFYTFFSVYTNRMSEIHGRIKYDADFGRLDLFKSYWWIVVLPAILGGAISRREIPDDPKEAVADILGYVLAGIPFVRDVVGPMVTGFNYSFSPVEDALEAPSDLFRAVTSKKERGRKIAKTSVMTLGYLYGLPSRQAVITMEGMLDMAQGKTANPARLFFPEDREEKKRKHYNFGGRK